MQKEPIVAVVIPARGGSKRIPGKNIKEFKGEALLCHIIRRCREIPEIDDIYVSTEDQKLLEDHQNLQLIT